MSRLEDYIKEDKYLFHVTSKVCEEAILESGVVLPLTMDYTRQMMSLVPKGEEKGTASFTLNPIQFLEEAFICFEDRDVLIMVFDRQKLVEQGVAPAIYVEEEKFREVYKDYMYAVEEAEFECEWRSVNAVNIREAYIETLEYEIEEPV